MTQGRCADLPRLKSEDHGSFLPKGNKARTQTRKIFKRFDAQIVEDCEALSVVPHHTTTMHLGELKGSIRTDGEHNVQLTIPLIHAPEGDVKILNLRSKLPKGS